MAKPTSTARGRAKVGTAAGGGLRGKSTASAAAKKVGSSVAALLKEQKPNWRLIGVKHGVATDMGAKDMKAGRGPTLESLRKKFLGNAHAHGQKMEFADVDKGVKTVTIGPKNGGPAKTADVQNGKITIVQG